MVQDKKNAWIHWRPEIADAAGWEDLAEAIQDFEPPCNEAGEECALWLKEHSLEDFPLTATWVLFLNGIVHGFFAMSSSSFTISNPHPSRPEEVVTETWPCSQIKWLCRRNQGKFIGRTFFDQAVYTADRVAKLQGNVALVIEPFDDVIAGILTERHHFLRTADQGQLWIPLYPEEDFPMFAKGG
ncbi:MAG TPA: hypothetical protein VNR67_08020 [Solirubrobacterales bacterium]|nr:hypothetical protein [Solirubrobacterales bacterium]